MRLLRPIPTALTSAYDECRSVLARHSSSYSWATRLLPSDRRPHVHALYAFARTADDLVDEPTCDPAGALAAFRRQFDDAVDRRDVDAEASPVVAAVANTIDTFEIPLDAFDRFFRSMTMDLTVGRYDTWADLLEYMDGSAAVIGEMMLPILDPTDVEGARGPARDLGLAFQLTNFLRDIGDDLERDRQYLPREDLERFGVDLRDRSVTPEFVSLMRFEVERARALYASAETGIALLPTRSAHSIQAALEMYARLLVEIEHNGYDVFARRATVSTPRKLAVVARSLLPH